MKRGVVIGIVAGSVIAGASSCVAASPERERRSGYDFMTPALRAMQDDETSNPGMLWVREGESLWSTKTGPLDRSCASCHGDSAASMRGVAARYPAFDERAGAPLALSGRIDACRVRYQGAAPSGVDDEKRLALSAYVGRQSRDLPVAPLADDRLEPYRARGEALYRQPMGQLAMSCAQCHDANAGGRLAGSAIPQAHPTGYPIYRLEWQTLGSLTRRVRGCMTGVRAEPFADGATELIELELYLRQRAAGLPVETPAVRP